MTTVQPTTAKTPSNPNDQQDVCQLVDAMPGNTPLTYRAGGIYLANTLHTEALKKADPAKTLDDIADELPATFARMGTAVDLAAHLLPEVTDRVWAFAVIAHARAAADDGYEYVFDLMADALRAGGDPQTIRAEVPRVVEKLRASRITARIWDARDKADGPWAGILDIVLATIEEGADPQAVIDQTLGLMEQVQAEGKAAA
ncbi:hypothetical protein QBA38_16135 [Streptomyces stelliscabiei]|uniref:hypothetical protein n=1 Tax=Streptomyces stelliscabiei TaxID=146820 RepID=UPI002FF29CA0